jgi:hypothetical protein
MERFDADIFNAPANNSQKFGALFIRYIRR